jgi:hypothetical protein
MAAMIPSIFNTNGDGSLGPTQLGDFLNILSTVCLFLLPVLLTLLLLLVILLLVILLLFEFLYNDDNDSLAFLSSAFLALISEGN